MKWVSVKERLPREYESILMLSGPNIYHGCMFVEYNEKDIVIPVWEGHVDSCNFTDVVNDVSHWIYLMDLHACLTKS